MTDTYDIIIVGGGIVSFASAVYAGRLHLSTLIIGEKIGGTILNAEKVENYPGFSSIPGIELFEHVRKHAEVYKPKVIENKVDAIQKKGDWFLVTSGTKEFLGKTVLLATGTEWRKLNVPGEKEFTGNGVHYCGLCDGYIYQDKVVAVIGGSDSAAKEAIFMTQYASKVYLIHRKEKLRAEPVNMKLVHENKKIECVCEQAVVEIKGKHEVDHIILDKPHKGSVELAVDGVFIDIGHVPTSQLCKELGVAINQKQQIIVNADCETNVPGVYAAGDVTNFRFKQAITGVGQGVCAVYSAYHYLNSEKTE